MKQWPLPPIFGVLTSKWSYSLNLLWTLVPPFHSLYFLYEKGWLMFLNLHIQLILEETKSMTNSPSSSLPISLRPKHLCPSSNISDNRGETPSSLWTHPEEQSVCLLERFLFHWIIERRRGLCRLHQSHEVFYPAHTSSVSALVADAGVDTLYVKSSISYNVGWNNVFARFQRMYLFEWQVQRENWARKHPFHLGRLWEETSVIQQRFLFVNLLSKPHLLVSRLPPTVRLSYKRFSLLRPRRMTRWRWLSYVSLLLNKIPCWSLFLIFSFTNLNGFIIYSGRC